MNNTDLFIYLILFAVLVWCCVVAGITIHRIKMGEHWFDALIYTIYEMTR